MHSDLAVKWLSLISIKSEQVSKICSMVKRLSHLMHIGGSSKKRMANVQLGHQFLFCFSEDKIYILLILGISYLIYFLGTHPTQTATALIYIYLCVVSGLRMGWAQPSSPSRASLAAESAAEFPPNANMAGNPDENKISPLSCHFCI